MSEMRRQTIEHHRAVRCHGGQATQSAGRFGTEPAESIAQGEVHRSFRLLCKGASEGSLALRLGQPDLEASAMQPDRLRRDARREVNLVGRLRGSDTLA